MSKNFELLQQADKLFAVTVPEPLNPVAAVEAPAGSMPALQLQETGAARDEITKLVQRLFLRPGVDAPRTVVVTATEGGNGCSWLCARVGELLAAHVTGAVCLLDCNFRNPSLHKQFGLENDYGLSDALLQNNAIRQYFRPLSRPNLWLMTSGSLVDDAVSLLASDRMRQRFEELRSEFAYVIVDAAALETGNDGIVLGGLSDGVVLVLKANSSRRDAARRAMNEFEAANIAVRGVILNRRTYPIPEAIYKRL